MWKLKSDGAPYEVVGEHPRAELIKLRDVSGDQEWIPYDTLGALFEPARCRTCHQVLTVEYLRHLQMNIEETI